MHIILFALAAIVGIAGFVCSIIILIDAFQDAIWKGLVCLLCGLYFLYYALFEFEHDNKWLVVIGSLGGGAIAAGIASLAK